MAKDSVFAGVDLLPRFKGTDFKSRLLRDTPAGALWRSSIDHWLQSDGDEFRYEFKQRLLSAENSQPSYNELLFREVLHELFGKVEREPDGLPVSGKPDFGVVISGNRTVVEVATLAEQLTEGEQQQRQIVAALKTIVGPWVVMPDWDSRGLLDTELPVIKAKVGEYLKDASAENHRADVDLGEGRRLRMQVIPGKRPEAGIGVLHWRRFHNPGIGQLQREIKDKAGKYSKLKEAGIPFVIAFFAASPLVDEESLFDALYGQQTINVWVDEEQAVQKVDQGALTKSGRLTPKGERAYYTTTSAVWFVQELPWLESRPAVRLVELPNPWAANPLEWADKRVGRVRWEKEGEAVVFYPPENEIVFLLPGLA